MGTKSSDDQCKPSPERFVVRIDPMPDRLPPDWDPMRIARERRARNVLGAEILCWQRIEDDPRWRVDSILLWGHFRRSPPGVRSSTFDVWCLTWLFCHPHIDKVWMPSMCSWPSRPARVFRSIPNGLPVKTCCGSFRNATSISSSHPDFDFWIQASAPTHGVSLRLEKNRRNGFASTSDQRVPKHRS